MCLWHIRGAQSLLDGSANETQMKASILWLRQQRNSWLKKKSPPYLHAHLCLLAALSSPPHPLSRKESRPCYGHGRKLRARGRLEWCPLPGQQPPRPSQSPLSKRDVRPERALQASAVSPLPHPTPAVGWKDREGQPVATNWVEANALQASRQLA